MLRRSILFIVLVVWAQAADNDRDGLDDDLEQALLHKFAPEFLVHPDDCDAKPSEFRAKVKEPVVADKNGTLYGQVSPARAFQGAFVEIHFFHLWSQDCGRMSHKLDAESVSALVQADQMDAPAKDWHATYWYAAAHEDTLCDMSHGARAADAGRGPRVWISKDKHASFLSRELCARGCGKDDCSSTNSLNVAKIVNLGEPNKPLNGADWIASSAWPLASKMRPDFVDTLLARMPDTEVRLVPSRDPVRGMRTTIKVAESTFGALESANHNTGSALATGMSSTGAGIGTAVSSTGKALKKAVRWMRRD